MLDPAESGRLLSLLDGLPLAIAQAAAYLQQSQVSLSTYLRFYEQQWQELMQTRDQIATPLQDYPNRSVWTTWTISFNEIREQDKATSDLLLLWSFLDNKNMWVGLFTAAWDSQNILPKWIGDLANSELKFTQSMQLLRNYSLVESVENETSYATHPVVHRWARYYCEQDHSNELAHLALVVVGLAVPFKTTRGSHTLQRQLLPHAEACSQRLLVNEQEESNGINNDNSLQLGRREKRQTLEAVEEIGHLFRNQGKLVEAQKIYTHALQEYEETLGPKHKSTLRVAYNLSRVYKSQGKLSEAEKMSREVLQGFEEALGPTHESTLSTINILANLYKRQGRVAEAEKMYMQALQSYKNAFGPKHTSALRQFHNLGQLYLEQDRLVEAEEMTIQALQGREEAFGLDHISTYSSTLNLAIIYTRRDKFAEAEQMFERVLRGLEEIFDTDTVQKCKMALATQKSPGDIHSMQRQSGEVEGIYLAALHEYQALRGLSSDTRQRIQAKRVDHSSRRPVRDDALGSVAEIETPATKGSSQKSSRRSARDDALDSVAEIETPQTEGRSRKRHWKMAMHRLADKIIR